MTDIGQEKFAKWVDKLVKHCLPIDLELKILSNKPLTKDEANKFIGFVNLVAEMKALYKDDEIIKKIDILHTNLTSSIFASRDEVIDTINSSKSSSPNDRGPKNTKFMESQREAMRLYIEVECHRHISTVTDADCFYIWNLQENIDEWNERAKRNDARRGYPSPHHLRNGVIYRYVTQKTKK